MTVEQGHGWIPGLLGWTTAEHGRYYAQHWDFGAFFEAKVAAEMAAFVNRLDDPGNHLLWARDEAGPLATVSIDAGEAEDGLVHLRWFIASDRARGRGLAGPLISDAIDAVRDDGGSGVFLWTFAGLDAARAIYERVGFRLVKQGDNATWGRVVTEQRWELVF